MAIDLRRHVGIRLTYLWTFELIGAALWSLLVWLWWGHAGFGTASAIGLGLVIFLLAQGSFYWYAKLRAIRQRPFVSDRVFVRLFRSLQAVNETVLVAAGLGGLVLGIITPGPLRLDMAVAGGLWTLALLEYVNYFHQQLMYDSPSELRWLLRNRRLKVSRLARDLAVGKLS